MSVGQRQPDWSIWQLRPEIEAWQAVALSLGVDPDQIKRDDISLSGKSHPFDEGGEFDGRLVSLLANISEADWFPTPGKLNMAAPYKAGVRLPEFCRFAVVHAKWAVPGKIDEWGRQQEEVTRTSVLAKAEVAANEVQRQKANGQGWYRLSEAAAAIYPADEEDPQFQADVRADRRCLTKRLEDAAADGTLPVSRLNSKGEWARVPGNKIEPWNIAFVEVKWRDLNEWLDANDPDLTYRLADPDAGISVIQATSTPTQSEQRTQARSTGQKWIPEVIALADEFVLDYTGTSPPSKSGVIAPAVACMARERGITNCRNKELTAGTIYREALQKWTPQQLGN